MTFFKSFAQYTFIIQGFAFPFLLLITCYAMYWSFTNKSRAKLKKEICDGSPHSTSDELEILKPLTCTDCGGVLLINSTTNACMHCGSQQSVPQHYSEIFKFREDASKQIQRANKYWQKANYITSPFNRAFLLMLTLWFIATFVILIVTDTKDLNTNLPLYNWYMGRFGPISIATLFFWMIIFLTIRGMIGNKLRKFVPEMLSDESVVSVKEEVSCSQCAAPIIFKKEDVGCVCSYCGVETYRVKFANRVRNKEISNRENAKFSLVESMEVYEDAKDDVIGGAIILPAILIVIPSILVLVFYFIPKMFGSIF
ncbi:MAG: hypothetical protein V4565_06005 [Bacteroidota bacterium]